MQETPYEYKRLLAIFESDGSEIRQQLLFAGLLLMIFERFKAYIVDQVDGFFSSHVEIKDGGLLYRRGEKFKKLIKEKGAGEAGQHANKEFRAALHWFYDLEAITKAEFDDVERIYVLRNEIGHELFRIIADDRKNPITIEDVLTSFTVYLKIVRWWIKEIEATTDPDFDQEKYDNTDFDSADSGDTLFLREIIRKTLVGDADLSEFAQTAQDDHGHP